ncbi:MAG: DUF721 domain-containing protein [Cytophagales bacterium]|nr:DUF721 domain-containing protein [Cytophagales bacterium]
MPNSETLTIRDVIQQMIVKSPYRHKFLEASIICAWKKIMPASILKRTRQIFVKNNKLFMKLDSAPLRQELQISKYKIIQLLKEENKDYVVEDIVIL